MTLASASSSQPESGLDREDVPDDVQESTTGTDDRSGLIRAERFGDTRTYTIRCDTTDPAGDRELQRDRHRPDEPSLAKRAEAYRGRGELCKPARLAGRALDSARVSAGARGAAR